MSNNPTRRPRRKIGANYLNMEEEIWKDIKGYEGYYKISSHGNVLSVSNGKHQYLTKVIGKGYYFVCFCIKNKRKYMRVHRLVASAFCVNIENKPQVNHIDGEKLNNYYKNLEWCTCQENIDHAVRTGIKNHPPKNREDQSLPIMQFSMDGVFIKEYPSINEASRQLSITKKWISVAAYGGYLFKNEWKIKDSCKGYKWKFKKDTI